MAELGRHVDGAEQERADRAAGAGDRLRLREAGVALDDHVQAHRPCRPLQQRSDDPHLVRGFDLGQHHRIGRGRMRDDREQVLEPEGRAHAVDPHHPLDAVGGAIEQRQRHFARRVLLRRDHGVLEIDRDHVGTCRQRLGEAVRAGPRHEQQVAPRLNLLLAHAVCPVDPPALGSQAPDFQRVAGSCCSDLTPRRHYCTKGRRLPTPGAPLHRTTAGPHARSAGGPTGWSACPAVAAGQGTAPPSGRKQPSILAGRICRSCPASARG